MVGSRQPIPDSVGLALATRRITTTTSHATRWTRSAPIVRIGAREDRGGFEVGPGGIRISRQPGFRGGFDISPGGPRLTIDRRGISGAVNLGPSGSRLKFGRGARAEAEFSPSATTFESEEVGASEGRATTPGIGRAAMAQRLTIYIPLPRLVPGTGARTQSPFTTVVISAPTGSIVRAYGQPQPEPTPSPSFRTSEVPTDKPDVEVIDSSGQGGSGYEPTGDSQPIRAPVVIVPPLVAPPRPVTPPNAPPVIPPVAATPPVGGRVGSQVQAPNSIVAGAPPRMREPVPNPARRPLVLFRSISAQPESDISSICAPPRRPTLPSSRCRGSPV